MSEDQRQPLFIFGLVNRHEDGETHADQTIQVPVIFVVHSMGGLVVKKVGGHMYCLFGVQTDPSAHDQAYILGSQDLQFQPILNSVCSIVFLATPHRGSSLADTLNKLLSISLQAPKQYVNDLQKNSARIVDINDQFRFFAEKVDIVSFFETQPTSMGIKKAVCTSEAGLLACHSCRIQQS